MSIHKKFIGMKLYFSHISIITFTRTPRKFCLKIMESYFGNVNKYWFERFYASKGSKIQIFMFPKNCICLLSIYIQWVVVSSRNIDLEVENF